jgi:uncharacterized membrane protein YphA (DoxX/SURF4 family)
MNFLNKLQDILDATRTIDFLGPLALRIYLAPIFIFAGYGKLTAIDDTAYFFGEYLGLPAPVLMAWMAGLTEFIGGILLVAGLAVRWIAVPLMITMVVAAATAHWDNGWHALPEDTLTVPWEWRTDLIEDANIRKEKAREILKQHGNYDWLTEAGSFTVLKNGIEFAATYFIMLLVLFFIGAGKYLSVDYYLARRFRNNPDW